MQSEQQFQQLMMQYEQLKNGALDIAKKIENEDFDSAINLIRRREDIILSCKCIRRYLELTSIQQKQVDKIVEEIKELELSNIKAIEKGMDNVQLELAKTQKSQKLKQAYGVAEDNGNIVNTEN